MTVQKLHHAFSESPKADSFQADNALVYAELGQFLDDKSLSLVLRDTNDDGKEAVNILRAYYVGSS